VRATRQGGGEYRVARQAGLSYVIDALPGIRREGRPGRFRYLDQSGKFLHDQEVLDRIRALVIPPAWTQVWICPSESGHLQATGRDARGRKQYRYHSRWRDIRDANKYEQLSDFVRALPAIRKAVRRHLRLPGLPREKILAAVVNLLEATLIRIGNERYARENGSFGLTTLRNRHVRIRGQRLQFDFRGKSGKRHHIELTDANLAAIVRRCRELPGQELFQYLDAHGNPRAVTSTDVNEYLCAISGGHAYTAKDFRTWAGTVLAALALRQQAVPRSEHQMKKNMAEAVRQVSQRLGNTPSICRKCYVHPGVMEAYRIGRLEGWRTATNSSKAASLRLTRGNELALMRMLGAGSARRVR
jgi:DNA topoisomerase-1